MKTFYILATAAALGMAVQSCRAQITAPDDAPAEEAAAQLSNHNSHMIGATVNAAQRNAQRRMLEAWRTSGITPQQYEITISQDTLRRLRTSGVAADFNVCSLVAKSEQPGTPNIQRGLRSAINCNVNGLGN